MFPGKRKAPDYKFEAWGSKEWDALINRYFEVVTGTLDEEEGLGS